MYYPFIRGRQFDLIALRELNPNFYLNQQVLPIIEPVEVEGRSLTSYRQFVKRNTPFILIANPQHGPTQAQVRRELINGIFDTYRGYHIGYIINQGTTLDALTRFCEQYEDRTISLIHYNVPTENNTPIINYINRNNAIATNIFLNDNLNPRYINAINGQRARKVTLRDGFNRAVNNAAYDLNPIEHFHDLHLSYRADGYDGFGDFCTLGELYDPRGFAPYAVTIHLTHSVPNAIMTYHFVSDDREDQQNTAGKFGQAVEKLDTFIRATPTFTTTTGSAEFRRLHDEGHYPGLPTVKKLSVRHHIELMAGLI